MQQRVPTGDDRIVAVPPGPGYCSAHLLQEKVTRLTDHFKLVQSNDHLVPMSPWMFRAD